MIANAFNNKENNFNLIRLLAAILVIYHHSFALVAKSDILKLQNTSFGELAVCAFFFISGILIANSFDNSRNIFEYTFSRFMRIFPAYFVVILLCVFILGPIFTTLELKDYFLNYKTYEYLKNIFLFPLYWNLPGVFETNQYYQSINGSLWTIPLEILCYLYILIVGFFLLLKNKIFSVIIFTITYFIFLSPDISFNYFGYPSDQLLKVFLFFSFGIFIYNIKEYILIDKKLAISCILILLISLKFGFFGKIFIFFGSYLILYVGCQKPFKYTNNIVNNDLSYGLYLYAFPIQQALISINGNINPYINFIFSLLITLVLAFLSWKFIEKKSLKFKHNVKIKKVLGNKFLNIKCIKVMNFDIFSSWKRFVIVFFIIILIHKWYYRPINEIIFPNYLRSEIFDSGWLPENNNENFRWINKKASLNLGKIEHFKKIEIEGYVPEDFKEVKKLEIFIKDKKIFEINFNKTRYFSESFEFESKITNEDDLIITFIYDNAHIPEISKPDQRILSGFIKKITIQ